MRGKDTTMLVNVSAQNRLIGALLNDEKVTKRDLQIAFYLHSHIAKREEIAEKFFGGKEKSGGNRANVGRALQRLAPYLKVTDFETGKAVDFLDIAKGGKATKSTYQELLFELAEDFPQKKVADSSNNK